LPIPLLQRIALHENMKAANERDVSNYSPKRMDYERISAS